MKKIVIIKNKKTSKVNTSQKYPSTKTTRESFYKIQKTYLHIAYSGFKLTKTNTQQHIQRVFLTIDRPFGAIKSKMAAIIFVKRTQHSLAKITPAVQARY